MRSRLLLPLSAAAGALVLSRPGLAQETEDLTIPVGECVNLEDSLERFACYERMVEAAREAVRREPELRAVSEPEPRVPAEPEPLARTESERPAAVEPSEDRFGFPEPARERQRTEAPPEIRSVVAAIEEPLHNRVTVTLENGQVWRQMVSQRYNLRVGHHVRVYGTRWGDAYRLSADELHGFIQVERVR